MYIPVFHVVNFLIVNKRYFLYKSGKNFASFYFVNGQLINNEIWYHHKCTQESMSHRKLQETIHIITDVLPVCRYIWILHLHLATSILSTFSVNSKILFTSLKFDQRQPKSERKV